MVVTAGFTSILTVNAPEFHRIVPAQSATVNRTESPAQIVALDAIMRGLGVKTVIVAGVEAGLVHPFTVQVAV